MNIADHSHACGGAGSDKARRHQSSDLTIHLDSVLQSTRVLQAALLAQERSSPISPRGGFGLRRESRGTSWLVGWVGCLGRLHRAWAKVRRAGRRTSTMPRRSPGATRPRCAIPIDLAQGRCGAEHRDTRDRRNKTPPDGGDRKHLQIGGVVRRAAGWRGFVRKCPPKDSNLRPAD